MSKQKIVTLDLTGCQYLGELHQRIKKAFEFPDFYGQNWDAFSDLLWSECDADKVRVLGIQTLPKSFDVEIKQMLQVLEDFRKNCEKYKDYFEFEVVD